MPLYHGETTFAPAPMPHQPAGGDSLPLDFVDPQLLGSDGDFGSQSSFWDPSGAPGKSGDHFLPAAAQADMSIPQYVGDDPTFSFAQDGNWPQYQDEMDVSFDAPGEDDGVFDAPPALSPPSTRPSARSCKSSSADTDITTQSEASAKNPGQRKRGRKPRIRTVEEKEMQLQRQRERNREAAGRCRTKKKEQTHELVQNAERLKERRDSLRNTVDGLHSEVLDLKEAVMKHRFCGAGQVDGYIQRQFKELVGSDPESALDSALDSELSSPDLGNDDAGLPLFASPTLSMSSFGGSDSRQ